MDILLKPATDLLQSSHSKCCKPAALTVLNGYFRPRVCENVGRHRTEQFVLAHVKYFSDLVDCNN